MFPLLSLLAPYSPPSALFSFSSASPLLCLHRFSLRRRRSLILPVKNSLSAGDQSSLRATYQPQNQQPPRTLFPGGYKRPEIKVPNLVLQLEPDEVMNKENDVLDLIDKAVSKFVGIVVLNGGDGSGGAVYEAARLLKSVVRDRAYVLVAERVDVAAAVGASGVVLSDSGLPPVVARNAMMDSRSGSVFLPLVARSVQTKNAAVNASSSEGADFLIYDLTKEEHAGLVVKSVVESVKIPIFVLKNSLEAALQREASNLLNSGASGLVVALEDLRLFSNDALNQLFKTVPTMSSKLQDEVLSVEEHNLLGAGPNSYWELGVAGFVKLEDKEKQLIEKEKLALLEALNVFQEAAPLMEEVSLLVDAIAQIDEPFLLAIVGEFNSGKSTVINAILGERYLKEGVLPTTNEITFLRYSELNDEDQRSCQRRPDGQLTCYFPAPILRKIHIVDTPGTNVILQRQQQLTEEFVPRADLLIFVISADRPLTESEVAFLRYTQQWKKKVVFVLNKADLYQNTRELEEAMSFVKENTRKLLNTDKVTLYPLSARSVLNEKLSAYDVEKDYRQLSLTNSDWRTSSFYEFENFLYSFLDGSTSNGMERVKLKLETPMAIADRLLSACEALVGDERQYAEKDLALANEIVRSIEKYVIKMESESISWIRRILTLIGTTKSRVVELIKSTMQLSNLDLVMTYALKDENSPSLPATSRVQNDIIGPALSDAEAILGEYEVWLQSNNVREGKLYLESFEKRWPSLVPNDNSNYLETYDLLRQLDQLSLRTIKNFSATAASKLFEREIREAFLGTFGGLGAAGLSASLLTSVLPSSLEDLLALGLCSAGGYIAISRFPARRQGMIEKVDRTANALAQELETAMREDLKETVENLESFVKAAGKPYQDAAQHRLEKLLKMQDKLSNIGEKLNSIKIEIQNIHVS